MLKREDNELVTRAGPGIQMRRLLLEAVRDVAEGRDPLGSHGQGHNVRPAQMHLPDNARWTETQLQDALVAQY